MVWLLGKRVVRFTVGKSMIIVTLAVLIAWFPAEAQPPPGKVYRIGFLRLFACADQSLFTDLRQGLRELGYTEGQNLVIECRAAPGQLARLPDLATELVRLNVDVLVTEGTQSTLAAKRATKGIPIVMVYAADPVASGLVVSLARPGGNVTGLSVNLTEIVWKNFEILKELVPRISRVALLTDSTNPGHALVAEQLDAAARIMGVRLQRIDVLTPAALDGAFAAALKQRAEALIVQPLFIGPPDFQRIAEFAVKNRLPTMTFHTPYLEAGLLMLYGASVPEQYRRAGSYVDKILRGAKPADLPVEQPNKYDFVVNLKTAKALGITIPQSILLRADEVIR
jgi:putative tryptophan/tyrosine transport system substrate-binding protein